MTERMMDYEFSNVTYYDDEDLKYTFERTMAVAKGLSPGSGHTTHEHCLLPIRAIHVRFSSDNAYRVRAGREPMPGNAGWYRVVVQLARRAYMFGSELEALSALTNASPHLPGGVVTELCHVFGRACCDNTYSSAISNSYLNEFGNYEKYPGDAIAFAALHITPLCDVKINKRVKPGAQEEAKILSAREAVNRTAERLASMRQSRLSWQRMLESAIETEEQAKVIHATAVAKLKKLEEGSDE